MFVNLFNLVSLLKFGWGACSRKGWRPQRQVEMICYFTDLNSLDVQC